MNLYEINAEIELIYSQVDEDGMLTDEAMEYLQSLAIDESTLIENVACKIKNLNAEAKALREEEKALAERRKTKENHIEKSKAYLFNALMAKGMTKYETSRAVLSFRKSKGLAIGDENALIDYLKANYVDLVKVAESVDKTGLKSLIEDGHVIPNAIIEERQNIQIK